MPVPSFDEAAEVGSVELLACDVEAVLALSVVADTTDSQTDFGEMADGRVAGSTPKSRAFCMRLSSNDSSVWPAPRLSTSPL